MTKSKFTDSRIMYAVKRVEAGSGIADIFREMGIINATFKFIAIANQAGSDAVKLQTSSRGGDV